MNVCNDLRDALHCSGAAHPLAERDPDAGWLAHEGAKHQFVADRTIESGPVEAGDELPDQRGHVRHVGDGVALALDQCLSSMGQIYIKLRLELIGVGGKVEHLAAITQPVVAA